MYTLRTVNQDGSQHNQLIGDQYHLIGRFESQESFRHYFKECFGTDHVADLDPSATEYSKRCYSFLKAPIGLFPLYEGEGYYIMSSDGKTFANISMR